MHEALNELPLAVFTTLAPVGAGGFIALAIALWTTRFSEGELKRLNCLTTIPFALVVIGILGATLHLTMPLHAIYVFNHLGASPMSNELAVAVIFGVAMGLYWLTGFVGSLGTNQGLRKIFALVVALLAIVFAVFVGLAYYMPTIASWHTPMVVVALVGYLLLGATAFAGIISPVLPESAQPHKAFKFSAWAVGILGLFLAVFGTLMLFNLAHGLTLPFANGAMIADAMRTYLALGCGVAAAGTVLALFAIKKRHAATAYPALILILVGVFAVRFAFYGMQIGVGL